MITLTLIAVWFKGTTSAMLSRVVTKNSLVWITEGDIDRLQNGEVLLIYDEETRQGFTIAHADKHFLTESEDV